MRYSSPEASTSLKYLLKFHLSYIKIKFFDKNSLLGGKRIGEVKDWIKEKNRAEGS
jgi:hypothetical protein